MKGDCQWFNSKIEGYFCESLSPEELECASEHLRTCLSCRSEVQGLRAMDPLVKQVFEFRMAKAREAAALKNGASLKGRSGLPGMWLRLSAVGATLSVAALLLFAVVSHFPRQNESAPSATQVRVENPTPANTQEVVGPNVQAPDSRENDAEKPAGSSDIVRAKDTVAEPKTSVKLPVEEIPILPNAPEFQVMDANGYSRSAQDYHGRVLLVGILASDKPEATENLQQLYQSLGDRPELRILGVSRRNQERLPNTTFPQFFNNGSRLFEAKTAEYVVVDKDGKVQMRGELTGDGKAIASKVKAKLDQLSPR